MYLRVVLNATFSMCCDYRQLSPHPADIIYSYDKKFRYEIEGKVAGGVWKDFRGSREVTVFLLKWNLNC